MSIFKVTQKILLYLRKILFWNTGTDCSDALPYCTG